MKTKPFTDTVKGPVEKTRSGWGWYDYPPLGDDVWRGDFATRATAREARKKHDISGSAAQAGRSFGNP